MFENSVKRIETVCPIFLKQKFAKQYNFSNFRNCWEHFSQLFSSKKKFVRIRRNPFLIKLIKIHRFLTTFLLVFYRNAKPIVMFLSDFNLIKIDLWIMKRIIMRVPWQFVKVRQRLGN